MRIAKEMPEQGEYVLATVKKIFKYGAICNLDEYNDMESFLHVSEVAPRWIKNIHEFIKDGQKIIALVHRVAPEKRQIDISLRRVSESDKRKKMEEYKRKIRATKLMEVMAKELKMDREKFMNEFGLKLEEEYGQVFDGLEEISDKGEKLLEKMKIRKDWWKSIIDVVSKNVKKPKIKVVAIMSIISRKGIDAIKESLGKFEGENVEFTYLGAPKYKIGIIDEDYHKAEKKLSGIADGIANDMKKAKGTFEIERVES